MSREKEIKNVWKLIVLHLFPGIILGIVYAFLSKQGCLTEYPKLVIMGLAGILSIVPLELGYLFYIARKEVGSFNIYKVLGLKSRMSGRQYLFYIPALFIVTGMLFTVLKPLSDLLRKYVFNWIPHWYIYVQDMSNFNKGFLVTTIFVSFFFFTIIGPIVEELYFRGFLLARMKWMGKSGVLLNVVLFSLYHFWSPWLIITRLLGLLPLYYFVYKKDSLRLAISVHCLCNFVDVIGLVMLLR